MPLTKQSGISCFKNLRGTRGEDHSDEEGEVCFRYREWTRIQEAGEMKPADQGSRPSEVCE